jgi:hypothetical protein
MIRWPHKREARPLEPSIKVNPRHLELQAAKEILSEIFHARPGDVEEMIQNRLEESCWMEENKWSGEDGLWPERFCLREVE